MNGSFPTLSMGRRVAVVLAVLGLTTVPAPARAQRAFPLAVEVRGGATHPVPCIFMCDDPTPSRGYAGLVETGAELNPHPNLSLYGTYASYGVRDYENRPPGRAWGYGFGLRLRLAPTRPLGAWVRAGMLRHRRTFVGWALIPDTVEVTSDWAWGHEYGAGLSLRVLPLLSLSPAIRYQSYRAIFGTGGRSPLPYVGSISTNIFIFDLGARVGR